MKKESNSQTKSQDLSSQQVIDQDSISSYTFNKAQILSGLASQIFPVFFVMTNFVTYVKAYELKKKSIISFALLSFIYGFACLIFGIRGIRNLICRQTK